MFTSILRNDATKYEIDSPHVNRGTSVVDFRRRTQLKESTRPTPRDITISVPCPCSLRKTQTGTFLSRSCDTLVRPRTIASPLEVDETTTPFLNLLCVRTRGRVGGLSCKKLTVYGHNTNS